MSNESLKRTRNDQILTPEDMYNFCISNIKGINFVYITSEDLIETRAFLQKRFENVKTRPGTQSFHEFVPIDRESIHMKRCSEDKVFCNKHQFLHNVK